MQFSARGIPFVVNTWMVRHITVEDYAVTTLRFYHFIFCLCYFYFYIFFCNCLSSDFMGIQFFPYGKIVEIVVGCHLCLMKSLAKVLYFFCNCLSFDFLGIQFFPYGKIVEIVVGCHICLMKSLAKVLLLLDFSIFLEGLIFNKQMFQIEICTGNLSNFLNQMF